MLMLLIWSAGPSVQQTRTFSTADHLCNTGSLVCNICFSQENCWNLKLGSTVETSLNSYIAVLTKQHAVSFTAFWSGCDSFFLCMLIYTTQVWIRDYLPVLMANSQYNPYTWKYKGHLSMAMSRIESYISYN